MHPGLQLMQDGAPGHSAQYTMDKLASRGITLIFWPSYSPDLNPIESLWNILKNYLQEKYGEKFTYDQLRQALKDTWESNPNLRLEELICSMTARCQAVIDANGMHTKF